MSTQTLAPVAERVEARYLEPTQLLDYGHPRLRALIAERGWEDMTEFERIGAIYDFVRNEILFGYSVSDDRPASAVLRDGYGQCNTKATLMMALLRATGIPCRLHGAAVDKRLQRGMAPELFYRGWRGEIAHSWVEVLFDGRWTALEGVILDREYLDGVRASVDVGHGAYCGLAVGTEDLLAPPIEWRGTDTAIQETAVNADFGTFDKPEAFFDRHANFGGLRGWTFRYLIQPAMNRKVRAIRAAGRREETHLEQLHQEQRARDDDD